MSGFRPNLLWKFNKPKPSSTLPTTNAFWADIDSGDDENETTEDGTNTAGNKTENQIAEAASAPKKKCYICGVFGHISKECPSSKEKYIKDKNSERVEPVCTPTKKCYACDSYGHISKDCPLAKDKNIKDNSSESNQSKKKILCKKCKLPGHILKYCPTRAGEANKSVDSVVSNVHKKMICNKCKIPGHTSKNCPSRAKEKRSRTEANTTEDSDINISKPDRKLKKLRNRVQDRPARELLNISTEQIKTDESEASPSAAADDGSDKPKKKLLNLTVKCFGCRQEGHPLKLCPMKEKEKTEKNSLKIDNTPNTNPSEANETILCVICKTHGHAGSDCPSHPANKKKAGGPSSVKPVLTSIEKIIKNNKCNYCGVMGHFNSNCPVKKWRIAPGASESEDFTEDFTSFVDGDKPEPINPTLAAAGAPGKVSGKPIQSLTALQKNQEMAKKKKQSKKEKALFRAQMWRAQQMGILNPNMNMPSQIRQPVPVTFINHPNANIKIPVKQVVPQMPGISQPHQPVMQNMAQIDFRPTYRAGIPRSFLNQQHQDQILQQNTKHQAGMNAAQPTQPIYVQDQTFNWQQAQPVPTSQSFVPTPQTFVPAPQSYAPAPDQHSPASYVPIQKDESMDSELPQAYSPSDVYGDMRNESGSTEPHEGSESPDPQGQKRLSAFQRLGPATQKKPKLTINLMCNKGQAVREVVDETTELVEEHTPVHLRNDVTTSTDETVMKYLYFWPWKKTVPVRRIAAFKTSKSAMLLEQEQMEESYDKDNVFIQITVTNYPKTWTKEELFDVLLEHVNFIPCFIEFTSQECKFLVIRSKPALISIHKMGFKIRKEDLELVLKISVTLLTLNQIDYLPRLVLRKRLVMGYDGEGSLNLKEFTLQSDISHFIYFPLNRLPNQTDLIQLQSVVDWDRLTELNLSHNRLKSIDGFHLPGTCPHLKTLDVSYNQLDRVTALLRCRNLPLRDLSLEGNPLCHHYTDPRDYVRVVRMLFNTLRTLDGVTIHLKGDLPAHQKNYCLHGAESLVDKYLDTFYPLLETQPADRQLVEDMFDENALMTVVYRYKFIHRLFRISSSSSKFVDDGVKDIVEGATSITKYINKWPVLKHDPFTFTVDVLFHSDQTTVVKICGIVKLTAESLAEEEHIISFSRTTVLHTSDGIEYKILNELLLWDEPSNECHAGAFQITKIRSKKLYVDLEFESTPDEETKEKLVVIFEHLTELDRQSSRKCLERKDWNLKNALDNFIQLLKLNDLNSIRSSADEVQPKPLIDQSGRQLVSLT